MKPKEVIIEEDPLANPDKDSQSEDLDYEPPKKMTVAAIWDEDENSI